MKSPFDVCASIEAVLPPGRPNSVAVASTVSRFIPGYADVAAPVNVIVKLTDCAMNGPAAKTAEVAMPDMTISASMTPAGQPNTAGLVYAKVPGLPGAVAKS